MGSVRVFLLMVFLLMVFFFFFLSVFFCFNLFTKIEHWLGILNQSFRLAQAKDHKGSHQSESGFVLSERKGERKKEEKEGGKRRRKKKGGKGEE